MNVIFFGFFITFQLLLLVFVNGDPMVINSESESEKTWIAPRPPLAAAPPREG
ncbi:hypothetical protein A2U01_0074809 [Trifolium medium]|uniref:Uncharacterized protein n=1 Tax=Trifolium medium TaxID=97028 RepID=A0A392SYL6_9FABA|nr:hypothetical protein [Trifolium medium]